MAEAEILIIPPTINPAGGQRASVTQETPGRGLIVVPLACH
jgi:hypothetical protein